MILPILIVIVLIVIFLIIEVTPVILIINHESSTFVDKRAVFTIHHRIPHLPKFLSCRTPSDRRFLGSLRAMHRKGDNNKKIPRNPFSMDHIQLRKMAEFLRGFGGIPPASSVCSLKKMEEMQNL
jgi:hypothetical protein